MERFLIYTLTPRNMTRLLFAALLALSLQASTYAQNSLPYYPGFESATDLAGWNQYRLGPATDPNYEWNFFGGELNHYYPVGGNDTTDDWMVSPALDLSMGATIDSVRFKAGGFGMPFGIDTVAMYLVIGDQNPANASSVQLLHLFTDNTYNFDNVWRAVGNIFLAPTTDSAYIAFRYQTIVNWLDVFVDDLYITPGPVVVCECLPATGQARLVPNPAREAFQVWEVEPANVTSVELLSIDGRVLRVYQGIEHRLSTLGIAPGTYFVRVNMLDGSAVQQLVVE